MASRDQLVSPNYITTGKKDDLSALRTFGCRVWGRPPGRRSAKLIPNSHKGIFLGFIPNADKNVIWYDTETHVVKIAKHVRFDEEMNDLPPDLVPPNVVHLQRTQNGEPLPAETEETSVDQFTFHLNPFSCTVVKGVQVTDDDPSHGLTLASDELNHRAYVTDVKENSTVDKMHATHKSTLKNVKGAYLVGINGKRVFGKDDAISMLRQLCDERAENLQLKLAIKRKLSSAETWRAVAEHNIMEPSAIPDADHQHQLSLTDVRCISAVRYPHLDSPSPHSPPMKEMEMVMQAIQSQAITPAEQAVGRFTRRKLRSLSTWEQWRAGEHKQLDHFHDLKMCGEPVRRPPNAIVLRPHWQCSIKRDGTRRSQNCCDGSPRFAPPLHGIASTCSSCVEQPVQRLFFALAARENYRVYGGDAQDAHAHSPPPETPTFVSIDDAYADWCEHRFKKKLDCSLVLPVLHALQGHPESGKLWEKHITAILRSPKFGFKGTTHDKSICSATFEGTKILLLRQVDNFAVACPNEDIAKPPHAQIGKALQLPSEDAPPFKYLSLIKDFNGLDVAQHSDAIKLSCEKCIDHVLTTHGWSKPSPPVPSKPSAPLPVDAVTSIYAHLGPPENTAKHAALVAKCGFAYRTRLGELLHAYVTCRPDIGYAMIALSKFSTHPHDHHFVMLKKVAKCLQATKDWGIIYRRSQLDTFLPPSNFIRSAMDPQLPEFPAVDTQEPVAFLDAVHANDLCNR